MVYTVAMTRRAVQLEEKLKNKTAKVGIVGLGYVGLPLAVAFSGAGFKVLGFDIQKKRADLVFG